MFYFGLLSHNLIEDCKIVVEMLHTKICLAKVWYTCCLTIGEAHMSEHANYCV